MPILESRYLTSSDRTLFACSTNNFIYCGEFGHAQKSCISRVECIQLKTKYFHVAWHNAAHDQYLLNLSLETQIMNVLLYFLNWKYLRQVFVKITKNVRNVRMTEVRWPIGCFNKSVQGFRVTCLFTGQSMLKVMTQLQMLFRAASWISFLLVGSRYYSSHNLIKLHQFIFTTTTTK